MCDHDQKVDESSDHDTVGSVSIDQFGNLAAATSTGGITGKQPGRVGDTPVIGSGAYADNLLGAVSTTGIAIDRLPIVITSNHLFYLGHGEAIMRVCLAREVLYRYELNTATKSNQQVKSNAMQDAVDESLSMMKERICGFGGVIAIGPKQEIGIGFTTKAMPWAYISSTDLDSQCLAGLKHDNNHKIKIHYGYNPGDHFVVVE